MKNDYQTWEEYARFLEGKITQRFIITPEDYGWFDIVEDMDALFQDSWAREVLGLQSQADAMQERDRQNELFRQ